MKKYLLLATVLIAQLFAADSGPLTARFINTGDLADESPIYANMRGFVGAETEEKWISAKATMAGQIDANALRRVLFFRGDELITSTRSGAMPLHIYPATAEEDGSYGFTHGQESIAAVYRNLVVDAITEESLFDKPGFSQGMTWRIRIIDEDNEPQEILAATLMPNSITDVPLITEMHKAAYTLFTEHFVGRSALYISMVNNLPEMEVADFGENLVLQPGLHNYFPGKDDGMRYIVTGAIN